MPKHGRAAGLSSSRPAISFLVTRDAGECIPRMRVRQPAFGGNERTRRGAPGIANQEVFSEPVSHAWTGGASLSLTSKCRGPGANGWGSGALLSSPDTFPKGRSIAAVRPCPLTSSFAGIQNSVMRITGGPPVSGTTRSAMYCKQWLLRPGFWRE